MSAPLHLAWEGHLLSSVELAEVHRRPSALEGECTGIGREGVWAVGQQLVPKKVAQRSPAATPTCVQPCLPCRMGLYIPHKSGVYPNWDPEPSSVPAVALNATPVSAGQRALPNTDIHARLSGFMPEFHGDLLPYEEKFYNFWTGYYSSRPRVKQLTRKAESALRSAHMLLAMLHPLLVAENFSADVDPEALRCGYWCCCLRKRVLWEGREWCW